MGLFSFFGKLLGLSSGPSRRIDITKSASAEGLPIIYGRRKVEPINVFKAVSRNNAPITQINYDQIDKSSTSTGNEKVRDNKDWLHRVGVWGQGPITGIEKFWIDGDSYQHGRFSSEPFFRAVTYYGDAGQTACEDLGQAAPGVWGAQQVGNGVAYSWLRFFNAKKKPQFNADPRVAAQVKGLMVWDPRLGASSVPANRVYSANRALVLLDYLLADYGAGLSEQDIHIDSFKAAADLCDSTMTIANPPTNTSVVTIEDYDYDYGIWRQVASGGRLYSHRFYQSSNTQKLYECDAVIDPKKSVIENVKDLLEGFGWFLPWSNGQFKLVIEQGNLAPVASFDEDSILGGWTIQRGLRDKRLNRVTITYPNRNKDYENDSVSWPALGSVLHNTLKDQDQGQDLHTSETVETITDHYRALAYAEYLVRKSRVPMRIEGVKLSPKALLLEPGDVIALTDQHQGFDGRYFLVERVNVSPSLEITVTLIDYDNTVYGLEDPDEEPARGHDGSVSPWLEPPAIQNLFADEVHETHGAGGSVSGVVATWSAPTDTVGVEAIYISWAHKTGAETPTVFPSEMRLPPEATEAYIGGLVDDRTYTIRAVYETRLGQESAEAFYDVDLAAQANTIYSVVSGSGAPAAILGDIGWTYIDVDTGDVYEKTAAGWGTPTGNIKGADGDKWHSGTGAPAGTLGAIGDFYLDTVSNDYYTKTAATVWTLLSNLNGGYKDYIYIRSATFPGIPSGDSPAGWSDAQPEENGNPVYESWSWKAQDGTLIGSWATPILVNRPGIERQYSVDGSAWHSDVQDGDVYFRERPAGTASGGWGATTRFKGEQGAAGVNGGLVAFALNKRPDTGGFNSAWLKLFGFTDGVPDETAPAKATKTDGSYYEFGGTTGNGESGVYGGVNDGDAGYIVVDTSGTNKFVNTVAHSRSAWCRKVAGAWQYYKAAGGWTNFSPTADHIIVGTAQRQSGQWHSAAMGEMALDAAPELGATVGARTADLLPPHTIAGGGATVARTSDGSSVVLFAEDVGATAKITVYDFTLYLGDLEIDYIGDSTNLTGKSFSTKYFVIANDATYAGGSVSYQTIAGATYYNALVAGSIMVGSITTPANGGTGSTGGGGGVGEQCVAVGMYLGQDQRAGDATEGTPVQVMNEARDGVTREAVWSNDVELSECVKLVSESGCRVICSTTTPVTTRDGSNVMAPDMAGYQIAVVDRGEFRWETCVSAEPAGQYFVAHISVGGRCYAAGVDSDRMVITHNAFKN